MERRRGIEERVQEEKVHEEDKQKNVSRSHEKQLGCVVSYSHNTSQNGICQVRRPSWSIGSKKETRNDILP